MKMSNDDVEMLRAALSVCRTVGIEAVVIHEGMIRGCTPTMKAAILTKTAISIDKNLKLGLARLNEFDKRLQIFGDVVTIEGKVNETNDVSVLTLTGGKSKVQFRCTKSSLIKYPKANEDEPKVSVFLSKAETAQLTRALKSLSAEVAILKIGRDGDVGFEAIDSTNDKFSMDLDKVAEFVNDIEPTVLAYEADRFAVVLDSAGRDSDEVRLDIGEFGSITMNLRGHTILIMPHINGDEEDDE